MKKMKLSMMSLVMGDMFPEEIVSTAVELGMTGIDWITLHNSSAAHLKKISEDAGLKIVAHTPLNPSFVGGLSDGMDEFKRSVEDAYTMVAPVIMIPPFPLEKQKSLEDDRKQWIEFYGRALPIAQDAGLTLCVESTGFPNSPLVSGAELLEAVTKVPGLKIAFDNGNNSTADDMTRAFELVKDYVVHFHLKDWKIYDSPHPDSSLKRIGKYFQDSVIGEGSLDLIPFLKEHVLPVYDGFFNLETCDPTGKRTPKQVMQQACDYLKKNSLF